VLAQRLSILKQSNHVRLKLTVRELVSFGRFPYSQEKLNKEDILMVDRAIDFLNLKDIENSYIDELSGGQKQRAYMAMVVAQDTEYILLDEPLNNLDMKHSVQTMKIMRKLADELGKTIIIVLHDINFASHYSDYIVALKEGKIIYHDTTENIIREDVLRDVFDINIKICEFESKRICNYY
jgi:iron complex transport system ATP-binding protein